MKVIRKIKDPQNVLRRKKSRSIGFVPTMGDLHEGHLSLIRRSKRENGLTVLSIFVNPAQFNQKKDFLRYHRNEKEDLRKAKKEKVDVVFIPPVKEIYPEGFETSVVVKDLSKVLCGRFRPGHFEGVATIVAKLFNIVRPDRAYFGLKDYQQLKIIERLNEDLNFGIKIVPCPTVREKGGLALSSRNRRLSSEEKKRALSIFSALRSTRRFVESKRGLAAADVENFFRKCLTLEKNDKLEYFEICRPETLVPLKTLKPPFLMAAAVWIGGTRLIDNLLLTE